MYVIYDFNNVGQIQEGMLTLYQTCILRSLIQRASHAYHRHEKMAKISQVFHAALNLAVAREADARGPGHFKAGLRVMVGRRYFDSGDCNRSIERKASNPPGFDFAASLTR